MWSRARHGACGVHGDLRAVRDIRHMGQGPVQRRLLVEEALVKTGAMMKLKLPLVIFFSSAASTFSQETYPGWTVTI